MYVLDASAAVRACLSEGGFGELGGIPLAAPPLLWSEVPSVLHELGWRGSSSRELTSLALERFLEARIARKRPAALVRQARDVAEELGWAKTYDAEYVALARLLNCPLVTIDARLQRGAGRLVDVIGPTEL